VRAPVGGARFAGLDRLPRRLAVGFDTPEAADAVAPEEGAGQRAAARRLSVAALLLVLVGLPIAAAALGLRGLGHAGLGLAIASIAAACVAAGLDRWGVQASAGLEPAAAGRVAARAMGLQAAVALLVLPATAAALHLLPAEPAPPEQIAAVLALALLAGTNPRWWFVAHGLRAALQRPVTIACGAALATLVVAMHYAPSVAAAIGCVAIAFAWTPWAAWRLHRGTGGAGGSTLPGALAVPWHAALRAGAPWLARRLAALAALFAPVAIAALALGPQAAGVVLWAGATAVALLAFGLAVRR